MVYDIGGRRLRTGEVAERAGVNVQTLRYYERRGLIAEPQRSRAGHPTADLRERATAKLAEVDRRIHDLHTIRDALVRVIEARCDSLTNCSCTDCPLPYADLADPDGDSS